MISPLQAIKRNHHSLYSSLLTDESYVPNPRKGKHLVLFENRVRTDGVISLLLFVIEFMKPLSF
jgi:hypothetical protein